MGGAATATRDDCPVHFLGENPEFKVVGAAWPLFTVYFTLVL
jgi:hypothetical protein